MFIRELSFRVSGSWPLLYSCWVSFWPNRIFSDIIIWPHSLLFISATDFLPVKSVGSQV